MQYVSCEMRFSDVPIKVQTRGNHFVKKEKMGDFSCLMRRKKESRRNILVIDKFWSEPSADLLSYSQP